METKLEFDFYQDVKVTTWVRQKFTVEADTKEEALKMVESLKDTDVIDSDFASMIYDTEWMLDSSEQLSVEENGGCSTIELYDSNGNLISKNGE